MAFTTRKSLLNRVKTGDEVSWQEFYETYKPLIILCGCDCGLSIDENEELVQLVMAEIFQKDIIGKYDSNNVPEDVVFKYDPARGRFRFFFKKIVRNQALKIYRKRTKNQVSFDTQQNNLPQTLSDETWDNAWDEEWRKHLLNMALNELREQVETDTYIAFEMYSIHGRSAKEVMDFLDISKSALYTAKSRCIVKLREIIINMDEK